MEPIGLAIGIVSLAGLFESCVQLADYIVLAGNLGRDYETTYTKYLLLKSRLYAWKPCLNVLEHAEPRENWSDERVLVGRCLVAIKALLEEGGQLEAKYGLCKEDLSEHTSLDSGRGLSESVVELEHALNKSARFRQQHAYWTKKIQWAIRDNKSFNRLVGDLTFHIDELEKLAARLNLPISSSIQRSIQNVTSQATMELLTEAVAAPDTNESDVSTARHEYIQNHVAEHARVLFGNVDVLENRGQGHAYISNQVVGNARVVFGNASGGSMSQFWAS